MDLCCVKLEDIENVISSKSNEVLSCTFADCGNNDKIKLSETFERIAGSNFNDNSRTMLLATCQRLEFYTVGPCETEAAILRSLGLYSNRISGDVEVLNRLSEIAAGLKSQILGERHIQAQVERAFSSRARGKLAQLGTRAVAIGNRARQELSISAAGQYEDIAFELLEKSHHNNPRLSSLILFGGGMLGRALAQHQAASLYKQMLVVSRQPKKVRRLMPDVRACNIQAAQNAASNAPVDFILASSRISNQYRADIESFIEKSSDARVINLSDTPLRRIKDGYNLYIDTFDKQFQDITERINMSAQFSQTDAKLYIRTITDMGIR